MKSFIFSIYMIGEYSPFRENAWEENIRVYYDDSSDSAEQRAKMDAIANQISYETNDGYMLSWRLYTIKLVNTLDAPIPEGEDIFFRSLTVEEATSLLRNID